MRTSLATDSGRSLGNRLHIAIGAALVLSCSGVTAEQVQPINTQVAPYSGGYESVSDFYNRPESYSDADGNYVRPLDTQIEAADMTTIAPVSNMGDVEPAAAAGNSTSAPVFVDGSQGPRFSSEPAWIAPTSTTDRSALVNERDLQPGYYTQVASFASLDNAVRMRNQAAQRHGTDAHVVLESGSPYYKVQVGPFGSLQEASALESSYSGKLRFLKR